MARSEEQLRTLWRMSGRTDAAWDVQVAQPVDRFMAWVVLPLFALIFVLAFADAVHERMDSGEGSSSSGESWR